jgi:hypothetical protein
VMDHADIERIRIELATGLPHRVQWNLSGTPWIFDFSRAQRDLLPGNTIEIVGGDVDAAWSNLLLFGEEHYDGGRSPSLGVHLTTGEIRGLDVERHGEPIYFINSTARQFIAAVGALDRTLRLGELSPYELGATLQAIDPLGYPRSDWRVLVTSSEWSDVAAELVTST